MLELETARMLARSGIIAPKKLQEIEQHHKTLSIAVDRSKASKPLGYDSDLRNAAIEPTDRAIVRIEKDKQDRIKRDFAFLFE